MSIFIVRSLIFLIWDLNSRLNSEPIKKEMHPSVLLKRVNADIIYTSWKTEDKVIREVDWILQKHYYIKRKRRRRRQNLTLGVFPSKLQIRWDLYHILLEKMCTWTIRGINYNTNNTINYLFLFIIK